MFKKIICSLLLFLIVITSFFPINIYGLSKDYKGHWAEDTIDLWINNGYINGYSDGSFKPEGLITRAEFIKMVNKLFSFNDKTDINFSDVQTDDWYYEEVQKAYKAGYINGISEFKFSPDSNLTREQAAVIISKIMNLEENINSTNPFADKNLISDWALDYVNSAAESKLITGYSDSTFRPQNPIKRAEAAVILFRTANYSSTPDIVVEKSGTIIENRTVNNIHITKEVGMGEVTLKNVVVEGELLIEGGGLNSIIIENSAVNNLIANKADGQLKILLSGNSTVSNTAVKNGVILAQKSLTGSGYKEITLKEKASFSFNMDSKVKFSSSNKAVATVNTSGLVTALTSGESVIFITNSSGIKTAISKINVIKPAESNDDIIKILSIGNSFSQDSAQWFYDIAESAGVKVVIGNLYISGCSLKTHWKNASSNSAIYNYDKWTSTTVASSNLKTMESAILDEDWDYITLQQFSGDSGLYDTFQPYLNNLASYIKEKSTNKDVKLALNMTWSYATNSTHNSFPLYNKDQLFMYYKIAEAYKKASADSGIDIIIPCGTAIQNGRTSIHLNSVGNELTNDGYHLNLGIGRYIAGLTYFETLIVNNSKIDKDMFNDVTFFPNWLNSNAYYAFLSKVAVKNAVDNPFKITIIK